MIAFTNDDNSCFFFGNFDRVIEVPEGTTILGTRPNLPAAALDRLAIDVITPEEEARLFRRMHPDWPVDDDLSRLDE